MYNAMDSFHWIAREPTEEILTETRLKKLLEENAKMRHYIGFEISGLVHIGTGLICMQKVADFQRAGVETTIFLADYHSWINKKLGGDLDTIKKVAGGYFREALKYSLKIVGGDPDKVHFVMGSELYEKVGLDYLNNIIKVSMKTTLSRVRRSVTIMGRKMEEALDFAQLLYIPMQVADIFTLEVNLAHGGMDQRKAHVIALEVGEKEFGYKPIAVHHHLLAGMQLTEEARNKILEAKRTGNRELFVEGVIDVKMSKSKPLGAIFIHDTEKDIMRKVRKALCPMGETELNPVLEITRYILFRDRKEPFEIVNKKTGERFVFNTYQELENAYAEKKIHPLDLKLAVAEELARLLEPARKYFLEGSGRKYLEEMQEIRITR